MSHLLFIDESGDHSLKSLDKQSPLFVLCGCIIKEEGLGLTAQKIRDFKLRFFGTEDVVLHYREIRKREGYFNVLNDKNLNTDFNKELNELIHSIDMKIIISAIDKQKHIETYGKIADDPYMISLNFIIERFIYAIDKTATHSRIYAEKRGHNEDQSLIKQWIKIYQRGTGHVDSSELQRKIQELKMLNKQENVVGLQIADLAVSCITRKILHPDKHEECFDVIKQKIHTHNGICLGRGIKVFPENSGYTKTISSLI